MNHTTLNIEEQRKLFDDALKEKDYEEALHLISEVQDDGRFPLLAVCMSQRLDLAEGLDFDHNEYTERESEKWSNYRQDNFSPILV